MSLKTKILITGASSELMRNFIYHLDPVIYDIRVITHNKGYSGNNSVQIFKGDICDETFVNEVLKGVQIVVHAAAVTHKLKPIDYYKVNVQGTINIVNAAKLNQVEKFVFISSRTAGENSGAYGLSKLQGEEYIKNNLNNWLIFRPAEVFGIGKQEGIEKLIGDITNKKFVLCPLNVKSKLYPIHAHDVIKIMYDCIFNLQKTNEIITINGNQGFTYPELIRFISEIISRKVFIIPVPKVIMYLIKVIIELTGIEIGLSPDQIPRLYSTKETQKVDCELISLKEYLKENVR